METEEKKSQEEASWQVDSVSEVSTFEDLLDLAGAWGPWNTLIFFTYSLSIFNIPLHTVSYQFLGATPDYWCSIDILKEANWTQQQVLSLAIPFNNLTGKHASCHMYDYNYTAAVDMGYDVAMANRLSLSRGSNDPIKCYSRDFNLTQYQSTVVTEWDLVCERRVLYSTTQAIVMGGNLVGFFLSGYISDIWGRRHATLLSYFVLTVSAFVVIASSSEEIYIFLKFLVNVAVGAIYLNFFVYLVGALMKLPFAVGYMAVPGIAYLVRQWRMLHLAFALPSLFGIMSFMWLPESPRWLIVQGQHKEALKVLKQVAKMNGKTLPPDDQIMSAMTLIGRQSVTEEVKKIGVLATISLGFELFTDLFILPEFRVQSLVSIWCGFAITMVYYGIALGSDIINTDPYLYVFLGGLMEVPAYLMLWVVLFFYGRRSSQAVLLLLSAICLFLVMAFVLLEIKNVHWVIVTLSLCSKIIITAAFQLLWMYTAELYPTKYRSLAVGQICTVGRIGTICSPYINDIMGEDQVWGPPMLFGLASLVSAALALLLPETRYLDLSEPTTFRTTKEKYEMIGKYTLENISEDKSEAPGGVPNYSSVQTER